MAFVSSLFFLCQRRWLPDFLIHVGIYTPSIVFMAKTRLLPCFSLLSRSSFSLDMFAFRRKLLYTIHSLQLVLDYESSLGALVVFYFHSTVDCRRTHTVSVVVAVANSKIASGSYDHPRDGKVTHPRTNQQTFTHGATLQEWL
jgi:hypothetical protein